MHAVIEAVSQSSEEHGAVEKYVMYAEPGVPHYWIIRREPHESQEHGVISTYELVDGAYRLTGTRLVSQLAEPAEGER